MWMFLLACRLTGPQAPVAAVPAQVQVRPWPEDAVVRIDGATTRSAQTLGPEVELVVERPGFEPTTQRVTVREGEGAAVDVRLVGQPQTVRIDTVPPGAAVSVAGEAIGVTPWSGELTAGPVAITLGADGWRAETVEAFVDAPFATTRWLDPEGQRLDRQRLVPTCSHPKAVLLHPSRPEAWVACLDGPPSVVAHDVNTGEELARVSLGETGAVELHWDDDASHLFASQMETAFVYEIDAVTHQQTRVMDTDSIWSKVVERSADGSHIYVSNWLRADIAEIRLSDGLLARTFPTVSIPRGLHATADGRSLYVAGFDKGELAVIDLVTGRSRTLWFGGYAARHLVADEGRGLLYLSDMGQDAIYVYDLASGAMRKLADTARHPNTIDLSDDGRVLFVSCRGRSGSGGYLTVGDRGAVMAIDTDSGAILDVIAAGHQPTALDVQGNVLVFSDFRDNRLQVYRIPPYEALAEGGRTWADVEPELRLPDPTP